MLNATYKVTSEPAVEPLTLAELKARLRVGSADFDDELGDLLIAGRKQVEHDSHTKLITQTVVLYLDEFPRESVIELRQLPVQSITSVQYVDDGRVTQTFTASLYSTDIDSKPVRIVLKDTEDWEVTEPQWPKAVTVTYVAGYGDAATDVPVEARLAIVEWCRMHWGNCDGDRQKYDNLINTLAWSGYWKGI